MNVSAGQFHFILIGQIGYFLQHFLNVIFGYAFEGRNSFNLQIVLAYHKSAIIEKSSLLQQHLEVDGFIDCAHLRSEGDHFPVVETTLLDIA